MMFIRQPWEFAKGQSLLELDAHSKNNLYYSSFSKKEPAYSSPIFISGLVVMKPVQCPDQLLTSGDLIIGQKEYYACSADITSRRAMHYRFPNTF